jgi:hypothetical protein
MLAPEYRVGFRLLAKKIGFWRALSVGIRAFFGALPVNHKVENASDQAEVTKADLKNHFQLLANMYQILEKQYGNERTDEIMESVLLAGGNVFFPRLYSAWTGR